MNFDEFKIEVLQKIDNKDGIPQEILSIIDKAFYDVEEIYNSYDCINPSIQEYMMECLEQAKMNIKANIGNERKNNYFEQVKFILNKLERESSETLNKEDKQNEHYRDFEEIGGENNKFVNMFNMILQEQMEDVNMRQERILSYRGYSDERIYSIQNEVKKYINKYIQNNEEEVYDLFRRDDKEVKEWLLSKYDEYMRSNKKEYGKDEFRNELYAGISLEEQGKRAKDFNENNKPSNNEKQPKLPVDLIL